MIKACRCINYLASYHIYKIKTKQNKTNKQTNLQSPTTPTISSGAVRATHPHHEFLFFQVEEMTKEDEEMDGDPFGFPIQETYANVQMSNIPPSVLPNFKGMRS